MSDGKVRKENRKHLKNEIESLLSTISSQPNEDLLVDNELAMETRAPSPYDFEKMSDEYTVKAREITDSLFKNFVDIGVFEKNDYARHKKELDTINISNLFFQLRTLKITIMKVMEEISAGNTHPRLLEVMGQLQDKMANITKMQANYVLFLEDTYKKLNNDAPANLDSVQISSNPNEGQFFISVGTKNVINSLDEIEITNSDYDESDTNVDISNNLVDPSNKQALLMNNEEDIKLDEEIDDDFINLDEII
jgi:hypothetical protein